MHKIFPSDHYRYNAGQNTDKKICAKQGCDIKTVLCP